MPVQLLTAMQWGQLQDACLPSPASDVQVAGRIGNFITGTSYLDEEDIVSAEAKQLGDGRTYYVYEVQSRRACFKPAVQRILAQAGRRARQLGPWLHGAGGGLAVESAPFPILSPRLPPSRCTRPTARPAHTTWRLLQPRRASEWHQSWMHARSCTRWSTCGFAQEPPYVLSHLQNGLAYLFTLSATDKQWNAAQEKLRTMLVSFRA